MRVKALGLDVGMWPKGLQVGCWVRLTYEGAGLCMTRIFTCV